MADFLSVDWDIDRLCVADGRVDRNQVQIRHTFELSWPDDARPDRSPERAGQWLRNQLDERGVKSKTVLVSLPRERAVIRALELPAVSDAELHEMVRLQAATKLSTPLDRLVLDFMPQPVSPGATSQSVLLASIVREVVDRLQSVAKAAGLEVASVGLSSAASVEIVFRLGGPHIERAGEPDLVIVCSNRRVEISVLQGRHFLLMHSASLSGENGIDPEQFILAEVIRSTLALQSTLPVTRFDHVWIMGDAAKYAKLQTALLDRLECQKCEVIDPMAVPGLLRESDEDISEPGTLAAPVGLLFSRISQEVEGVDFLHPRQPEEKKDRRKLLAGAIGGAVSLLLALAYGFWWLKLDALDKQIGQQEAQLERLDNELAASEPIVEAYRAVDDWNEHNVDWLAQLEELRGVIDERKRIYLSELHTGSRMRGTKATLKATGFALDERDVDQFARRLFERGFVVPAPTISPAKTDEDFPFSFTIDIRLFGEGEQREGNRTRSPFFRRTPAGTSRFGG